MSVELVSGLIALLWVDSAVGKNYCLPGHYAVGEAPSRAIR